MVVPMRDGLTLERSKMDISAILEAGLQANQVAVHALDAAGETLSNLSMAVIPSDCCGSNNYPTPPQ